MTFKATRILAAAALTLLGIGCGDPTDGTGDDAFGTAESALKPGQRPETADKRCDTVGSTTTSKTGVLSCKREDRVFVAGQAVCETNTSFCCEGTADKLGTAYDAVTTTYLGYSARSNGQCTGASSGVNQCAQFVKDLWSAKLRRRFSAPWGVAANAADAVADGRTVGTTRYDADQQLGTKNSVFVFRPERDGANPLWTGVNSLPRDTDALVFKAWKDGAYASGTGHIVLARDGVTRNANGTYNVPIIEENVASNGAPLGSRYTRVLVAAQAGNVFDIADSGIGASYRYAGFLRHNGSGVYANGFRDDGTSAAFRNAYGRHASDTGWAVDNGGGMYVHEYYGLTVQDFHMPCDERDRAQCKGKVSDSIYVLGPQPREGTLAAYRLAWGFREWYLAQENGNDGSKICRGCSRLQRPLSDEYLLGNGRACQVFELGYLYWDGSQTTLTGDKPDPRCLPMRRYDNRDEFNFVPDPPGAIELGGDAEPEFFDSPPNASPQPEPAPTPSPTPAPQPSPGPCTPGAHRCVDATHLEDCSIDAYGNPYWSMGECNEGFACEPVSAQCQRVSNPAPTPAPPAPAPAPTPSPTPDIWPTGAAVRVVTSGTNVCVQAKPALLAFNGQTPIASAVCVAGSIPGANWSTATATTARSNGTVEYCMARSDLQAGTPFAGHPSVAYDLPYRFGLVRCGTTVWADVSGTAANGYLWTGISDQNACVSHLAFTVSASGTVTPGGSVPGGCTSEVPPQPDPEPEPDPAPQGDAAVTVTVTATTVTITAWPADLPFPGATPASLCLAGTLPGIDWANGVAMTAAADGSVSRSFARSAFANGMPLTDDLGNGLPYRFGIKSCTGSDWAEFTADTAGELLWTATLHDNGTVACSSALAFVFVDGEYVSGSELSSSCE